ncbi:hypothetical protein R6Q59_019966 [Mikania micrantha]|uniref:RING-type E3 ubiquitin transferase n=1 Tax=Mikania micrantha TaxID=192012 RepID=A0A5N6PSZ6_9ASTR|nr:hypothetical protein E3N88_07096 [Mikania micrantha]
MMNSGSKNHNRLTDSSITFTLLLISSINAVKAQPTPSPDDEYQYARFSPSIAVIVVVLVAALFLMGFFSIFIRRCSETDGRGSGGGFSIRQTGRLGAGSHGLDPGVLEMFPTFAYSNVKGLKIGKGALECAVCLNEFEDEETIRLIPLCDHVFHAECIDTWLENHVTCPVCRSNLVLGPPNESTPGVNEMIHDNQEQDNNNNNNQIITSDEGNFASSDVIIQVGDEVSYLNPVLNRIKSAKPPRAKSVRGLVLSNKFRSHSTGHSLVHVEENTERFTLRLPDDVRKQVISNALLNRSRRSTVRLAGEGSARKWYRTGEGSSKGRSYRRMGSLDRSVFSRAPSILSRAFSVRSQKVPAGNGGPSTTSDETPLNSTGPKSDEGRPPV